MKKNFSIFHDTGIYHVYDDRLLCSRIGDRGKSYARFSAYHAGRKSDDDGKRN